MSKPVLGMLAGMIAGALVGVLTVMHFSVELILAQFCVIGSTLLTGQLLGATIAAALGKPHQSG